MYDKAPPQFESFWTLITQVPTVAVGFSYVVPVTFQVLKFLLAQFAGHIKETVLRMNYVFVNF